MAFVKLAPLQVHSWIEGNKLGRDHRSHTRSYKTLKKKEVTGEVQQQIIHAERSHA